MKGIVLAGGSGTRLHPITKGISKQLLPVYDKPMIYYPISVLMLAGIRDILVITTPEDESNYIRALGDGSEFGINLSYAVQSKPSGVADAFIIGEKFINNQKVCLVLGDNIFWGQGLTSILKKAKERVSGATVFTYKVRDPHRYGVATINKNNKVTSIEEKPINPKSNFAVTGLYFYDENVSAMAKQVKPSERGELEITTLNQMYMEHGNLHADFFGRGFAWVDTGTHESLSEAAMFVETIEKRQGYKIACLEEIALNNNWLSSEQIKKSAEKYSNDYGEYLAQLVD